MTSFLSLPSKASRKTPLVKEGEAMQTASGVGQMRHHDEHCGDDGDSNWQSMGEVDAKKWGLQENHRTTEPKVGAGGREERRDACLSRKRSLRERGSGLRLLAVSRSVFP